MKHDIDLKKQSKTPYLDNYQKYLDGKYTAFDVPGHHQGGIITPFDKVFTHIIYEKDINCDFIIGSGYHNSYIECFKHHCQRTN